MFTKAAGYNRSKSSANETLLTYEVVTCHSFWEGCLLPIEWTTQSSIRLEKKLSKDEGKAIEVHMLNGDFEKHLPTFRTLPHDVKINAPGWGRKGPPKLPSFGRSNGSRDRMPKYYCGIHMTCAFVGEFSVEAVDK